MCDRVRYVSVPPPNSQPEDTTTLMNPSYSSTIISSTTSDPMVEPNCAKVELELGPVTKGIPADPQKIKLLLLSLLCLIAVLFLLNIILIFLWTSDSASLNVSNATEQPVPSEVAFETVIEEALTTTDLHNNRDSHLQRPTISSTGVPEISKETLTREYGYFTRRFDRPKTDQDLLNFIENYKYFTAREGGSVAETQFSDLSLADLKKLVNGVRDPNRANTIFNCNQVRNSTEGMRKVATLHEGARVPSRSDLRSSLRMPAVKNQGTTCNGGYAFAVASAKSYASSKFLSAQSLLCDKHNFHCQGGEMMSRKFHGTANKSGLANETDLPFSESQKWCDSVDSEYKGWVPCFATDYFHSEDNDKIIQITTEAYIQFVISMWVPAIVEVPVDRSFFFYKSGLYSPDCSQIIGYQPAIVVGYDKRDGVDVWILRNSFGTDWGIEGDFEMKKGDKMEKENGKWKWKMGL